MKWPWEYEAEMSMAQNLLTELRDEIKRLSAPKPEEPKPPFVLCACGSKRTYVLKHIIGWRRGGTPEPIGGTVQCVDCGQVWHVDQDGMEKAKPVAPDKPSREKPTPKDDRDLKWVE